MSRARQVTRGWTELHTGVGLCLVLTITAGLLGGLESGPLRVLVPACAVVCLVIGMMADGFVGVVVGLIAAAAAVSAKRFVGVWNRDQFMLAVTIAVALLVLGWAAGMVGSRIRELVRGADTVETEAAPVFGSLGLLAVERARPRLDDEIARARVHRRPLALLMVNVRVTDDGLDETAQQSVRRAVARLVESLLRESDVPFALTADEFGAILPETDAVGAWSVVGPLVDAAGRSSFTDRATGGRRGVADCAEVTAGLAFLSESTADGDAMIAEARSMLGAQVIG
ncbi:hypothetical protein AAFP35_22410 [Gordonia sp. CPCC 206044]|uniref:hypothetical protein n=1 Tax=Gordonia sp. CPCC 206044 TaxID=3140793 RepID=UPI003AF3E281